MTYQELDRVAIALQRLLRYSEKQLAIAAEENLLSEVEQEEFFGGLGQANRQMSSLRSLCSRHLLQEKL